MEGQRFYMLGPVPGPLGRHYIGNRRQTIKNDGLVSNLDVSILSTSLRLDS
jgi:hypothetical protein